MIRLLPMAYSKAMVDPRSGFRTGKRMTSIIETLACQHRSEQTETEIECETERHLANMTARKTLLESQQKKSQSRDEHKRNGGKQTNKEGPPLTVNVLVWWV